MSGTDCNYQGKTYSGSYGQGPKGECRAQTTDVDNFSANAFGLYDLHGNVWEWCQDHWHKNYEGAPTDGSAWLSSDSSKICILRGGSWDAAPGACRSASRDRNNPDNHSFFIGFRVSCAAPRTP